MMHWPCRHKVNCEGGTISLLLLLGPPLALPSVVSKFPGFAVGCFVGIVIDVATSLLVCRLASPISSLVLAIVPRAKIRVLRFKRSKAKRDLSKREL